MLAPGTFSVQHFSSSLERFSSYMTNLWNDQASFRFVLVVTEDSQHLATSGMPAVRFGIDYGGQFALEKTR